MDQAQIDQLLATLAKSPANHLLRIAIVRRLMEGNAKSKALSLVIDLPVEAGLEPDDRALVAGLLDEAGLADLARQWSSAAPVQVAAAQPEPATVQNIKPPPGAKPALRVVTAKDAENVVALPEPPQEVLNFRNIGGLGEVKRDIERRIIAPFTQKSLFARFRKRIGGGVLLYGPPGCGKTLLARATAGECGFPFQAVSIPEILDPYIGVSEQRMSQLFTTTRSRAPAVLFFDEIDALASKRTSATTTHQAQLVSNFLTEMDGAGDKNEGVLVLAASNVPWSIDNAFLRPGRFDRSFFVPPPDREARKAIFELELGKRPKADNLDLDALAKRLTGYSGADIAGIVERAADMAIDASMAAGKDVPIDQKMLSDACASVQSTVTEWLTTARNYATYSNESGRYNDILAFLQKHARG